MDRQLKFAAGSILAIGFVFFGLAVYVHVYLNLLAFGAVALLAILLFCAAVINIRFAIKYRHTSFLPWFALALFCIGSLLSFRFAIPIGKSISDNIFRRHIADYTPLVEAFKNQKITCNHDCTSHPVMVPTNNLPDNIRAIFGAYCDDGGVEVEFLSPSSIPLNHAGYLYKGYGENSSCNLGKLKPENRLYIRHIEGNWYHFSDAPDL